MKDRNMFFYWLSQDSYGLPSKNLKTLKTSEQNNIYTYSTERHACVSRAPVVMPAVTPNTQSQSQPLLSYVPALSPFLVKILTGSLRIFEDLQGPVKDP